MRTTLTLEPDVAEMLRKEIQSGRTSLKQAVNERLRIGFGIQSSQPRARFKVAAHSSPFVAGVDPARLNQLADELEAEAFKMKRHPQS